MQQFLARRDELPPHRALRRMQAENPGSGESGWLDASTEFTPGAGFRYEVVAEGGSGYIRSRVLRAVLEGERNLVARGGMSRSAIAMSNYVFQPGGFDPTGLVKILLSPRRKETMLITGAMFLTPEGDLTRIEGRLAASPSFWVKRVDIVRSYHRIDGVLLPIAVDSTAHVRFVGKSTLRMTYEYSEVGGRTVQVSDAGGK